MTFYERAWKERVKSEDKAALEHTVGMRSELMHRATASPNAESVTSGVSDKRGMTQADLDYYRKFHVAGPIGSSVRSTRAFSGPLSQPRSSASSSASSSSGAPFSTTTGSQVSHHAVSSVGRVSGASQFSNRLTSLEQELLDEKASRKAVQDELKELKEMMMAQTKQRETKATTATAATASSGGAAKKMLVKKAASRK